jgi:transposase InsO family protein
VVRGRDHAFDSWAATAKTIGIGHILKAPRSPWQNAYVERFIGSARCECLDHVIVFSATRLQWLMRLNFTCYEHSLTHLSLNKDAPIHHPVAVHALAAVAIPEVGNLHHRWERQAA